MACSAALLNFCVGSPNLCRNVGVGVGVGAARRRVFLENASQEIRPVNPSPPGRRSGRTLRSQVLHSFSSLPAKGRSCSLARLACESSSSSPWVEEGDPAVAVEGGIEGSPEVSSSGEDGRGDIMKEVMRRLAEEDVEEAAKKYNYEDELFSQIDFAQINAFTGMPFSGNPAAVCYLPYARDERWLQLIAREFNLPATAFVVKRQTRAERSISEGEGTPSLEVDDIDNQLPPAKLKVKNEFDIRWFSTTCELELCGHATLASAHMLFSSGVVAEDTIIFHSKKGTLKARKIAGYDELNDTANVSGEDQEDPEARIRTKVELGKGVVELDFPVSVVSQIDVSEAHVVSDALRGVETVWVGRTAIGDYLVELPSSKHVEQLQPQFEKMTNFSGRGGVIVTARASEGSNFDFISRFFVPKMGISEDPVTGSAHCSLGPYWSTKLGKDTLQAYQASERGGELSIRVDLGAGRVYLRGGAVLLMAGTLLNTYRI